MLKIFAHTPTLSGVHEALETLEGCANTLLVKLLRKIRLSQPSNELSYMYRQWSKVFFSDDRTSAVADVNKTNIRQKTFGGIAFYSLFGRWKCHFSSIFCCCFVN